MVRITYPYNIFNPQHISKNCIRFIFQNTDVEKLSNLFFPVSKVTIIFFLWDCIWTEKPRSCEISRCRIRRMYDSWGSSTERKSQLRIYLERKRIICRVPVRCSTACKGPGNTTLLCMNTIRWFVDALKGAAFHITFNDDQSSGDGFWKRKAIQTERDMVSKLYLSKFCIVL